MSYRWNQTGQAYDKLAPYLSSAGTYMSSEPSVSVDTGFFSERKTKPLPRGKSAASAVPKGGNALPEARKSIASTSQNNSNTDNFKAKPTASVRGGEERSNTSRGSASVAKPKEPTIAEASSFKTGTVRKSTVGSSRANNITDGSSKATRTVSERGNSSATGISYGEEPIASASSSRTANGTIRKPKASTSQNNIITDGSSKATRTQAVSARGTDSRGSASSINNRVEHIAEVSSSRTANGTIRGSANFSNREEPQATIAGASSSKAGTIRKSKVGTAQNDKFADGSSLKVAACTVSARGGEGKGKITDEQVNNEEPKTASRKRVAKPPTDNCVDMKGKKSTETETISKTKAKQETVKENIKGPAVKQVKKTEQGNTNIKARAKVAPNRSTLKEGAASLTAGNTTAPTDKDVASTSRPLKRKKEEAPKRDPPKKRARVVYSDSESVDECEERPVTLKQKKEDVPKRAPSKKKARVVCDSESEPEDEWDEIINISKPCTTTKDTTGRVLKPLSSNSPSKDPKNWELEVIDDYEIPKRRFHAEEEAVEEDDPKLDEELDAGFLEADMLESEFDELEPCSSSQPYSNDADQDSNSDDSDSDSD